jgi:hypothetical protein
MARSRRHPDRGTACSTRTVVFLTRLRLRKGATPQRRECIDSSWLNLSLYRQVNLGVELRFGLGNAVHRDYAPCRVLEENRSFRTVDLAASIVDPFGGRKAVDPLAQALGAVSLPDILDGRWLGRINVHQLLPLVDLDVTQEMYPPGRIWRGPLIAPVKLYRVPGVTTAQLRRTVF